MSIQSTGSVSEKEKPSPDRQRIFLKAPIAPMLLYIGVGTLLLHLIRPTQHLVPFYAPFLIAAIVWGFLDIVLWSIRRWVKPSADHMNPIPSSDLKGE